MKEMEWVRQVARMRVGRDLYSILFRKSEGKLRPVKYGL